LPAPEKVTTEEAQLLERIRGEVGKRGLVLGEPIPARALERFEKAHGVRLPAGFRTFLLRIGNGGSGPPAKGLRALEETPHLDLDFPFTESRDWVDVEEQVVLEGLHRNASHGRLRLGGNAEGEEMILIVSGPERGKVWLHGEDGVAPYEAPNDFLSWYSGWLFS